MDIKKTQQKAEKGNIKSQEKLAWYYDVKRYYKKAFHWYKSAALNGNNPIIYYNLALCYLRGNGTAVDYKKAFYWTQKAAKLGDSDAKLALAWHYYNGIGIQRKIKLAQKYYMGCIGTKNATSAYFSLGQIAYEENNDYKMALKFFLKAAQQSHPKSCYFLGRMFFEGKGIEKNIIQAKKNLKKAALKEPKAKRLLESQKFKNSVNAVGELRLGGKENN
ncbi:MAG: hypothetical protein A2020_03445 [Lentisphaerae bacterium GWF2_45_14]|nr:MAG: hypothetical protein A2020_03445 [Lentisphaerae bacterium GWF2_45_14]